MVTFDPEETTADPGALETAASDLRTMGATSLGAGENMSVRINSGAADFSELIAPHVQGNGSKAISAARGVMQAFTIGAGATEGLASDVQTYKDLIEDLRTEYTEQRQLLIRSSPGESPDVIQDSIDQLAERLNGEAEEGREELETAAANRGEQLGSTDIETVKALNNEGHLGYAGFNLWGVEVGLPQELAAEEAERAGELLSDDHEGEPPSEADLEAANEIMDAFEGDANFSTELLNTLGAEGFVAVAATVGAGEYRKALIKQTQENLGITLAAGTDPDKTAWVGEEWIQDFMNAGVQPVDVSHTDAHLGPVYGYDAVAPLLTQDEHAFDSEFLVPVADHMFRMDAGALARYGSINPFDPDGELPSIPLNSALIALDNNPDSATILLAQGDTYDEYVSRYVFQDGVGGALPVAENLDHLLENSHTDVLDPNLVGNAIQAGATGQSSNVTAPNGDSPPHSQDMVDIVEQTMRYVADNPDDFSGEGSRMGDSLDNLGNITVHYMEDFFMGNLDPGSRGDGWVPDPRGVGLDMSLFEIADSDLKGSSIADVWMRSIGYDQAAGTNVSTHSTLLLGSALEAGAADSNATAQQSNMEAAVRSFAGINGEMTEGRLAAIQDDKLMAENQDVRLLSQTIIKKAYSEAMSYAPGGRMKEPLNMVVNGSIDYFYNEDQQRISDEIYQQQQGHVDQAIAALENEVKPLVEAAVADSALEDKTDQQAEILDGLSNFHNKIELPEDKTNAPNKD